MDEGERGNDTDSEHDSGSENSIGTRYCAGELNMPIAPQSKIAESALFKELRESVAQETASFTFACGGSIPISASFPEPGAAVTDSQELQSTSCPPIDLRWDPNDPAVLAGQAKVTFPTECGSQFRANLERLIQDMAPATFGRGGEDIYDESYRKATKMDPTQFSSTFNPYELGIVDAVAQALLPSLRHAKQTRAVKAELYKLNMYSGPSGKFKAHVDTPRSPAQFGSLVVCLPLSFVGGALEVRHKGKTVTFDWGSTKTGSDGQSPSICWAAFYSDCEHEIREVTKGHRLTLTYNLYSVRGNGQLAGHFPWLDPTQLPLYKTVHDLVRDENGWGKGGLIGYNCSHVYPHTTKTKLNFLAPDNLKGADMLMYEIFNSLGLTVGFRHVVSDRGEGSDRELPVVGLGPEWEVWSMEIEASFIVFDSWSGRDGHGRHEDEGQYIDFLDVHWLNDWGHQEPQLTWISFGNEAQNEVHYSCVAMIVGIPGRDVPEAEEAADVSNDDAERAGA